MSEPHEVPDGSVIRIPLDGTYGSGPLAEVTIFTRESASSNNLREEKFEFPYSFIDQAKLVGFNAMHLITGFSIIKMEKPNALRELGL